MARMHTFFAASILSFAAVGCVSSEKYNAARMDSDQYAQRLAAAERGKDEAAAARDAYKAQLDNVMLGGSSKDALVVNLTQQNGDLQRQVEELQRKYQDAAGKVGTTVLLPQELNDALKQFAAQNPELVDFDANRGIVKFKSDVTFAPGQANLTSTATTAIDKFAGIVNSPSASGYELMIVGHTDNQRVAHEATIRAGHKDNWYLSAHRAIAVSEEMQKKGVSGSRLEVAGFADQRPVASNASESGKAQNRRVEVLILPSSNHSTIASTPSAPSAPVRMTKSAPAKPAFNKDVNKDVADIHDAGKPVFNK